MPAIVCPSCGAPVSLLARKDGYCDFCRQELPEEIPEVERLRGQTTVVPPGLRRPEFVSPAWNTVRLGLAFVPLGLFLLFLCLAVVVIGAVAAGMAGGGQPAQPPVAGIVLLFLLCGLGMIAGGILVLIGQCMCCAVPRESAARGWAISSTCCLVIVIFLGIALALVSTRDEQMARQQQAMAPAAAGQANPDKPSPEAVVLNLLAYAISTLGGIFFALFLRHVALYFQDQPLARSALRYLFMLIGLPFAAFALGIGVGVMAQAAGPNAALGLMWIVVAFAVAAPLALLLWFFVLVWRARILIANAWEQGMA